jgi:hypothetical protein
MTFLNVLLYVAVIGYVLFKKVQGHPMRAPKKLFGLPIVLIVLGFGDLSSGHALKPVEITLIIIGAVLSVGLGLMRGQADKVSTRNGTPGQGVTGALRRQHRRQARARPDRYRRRRQHLSRGKVAHLHPRAHPTRRSRRSVDANRRRRHATESTTAQHDDERPKAPVRPVAYVSRTR